MLGAALMGHENRLGGRQEDAMKSVQKFVATVVVSGVLAGMMGASLLQAQTPKAVPAYVVVEFTEKDPEAHKEYRQRMPATLTPYGARFTVRGAQAETLHGDEQKARVAIIAFDSMEQAKKWANSSEYNELKAIRDRAIDAKIYVVEGVAPTQ